MKPIERVKKLIEFKKISISAFEKATGMSNNSIQTALKRNSNLKDDTLNSILIRYPDISAEWLLTGQGSMLKSEGKTLDSVNEPQVVYKLEPGEKELLLKEVGLLNHWVGFYKTKIEFLEAQLEAIKNPRVKTHEETLKMLQDIEDDLMEQIKKKESIK